MSQPAQQLNLSGDYAADLQQLSNALRRLVDLSNAGVELTRNVRCQVITREFSAPLTSDIIIATGLSSAPLSVVPLGFWRLTGGLSPVAVASSFPWKWDGKGSVSTAYLTGLPGTDRYRLSLLILEA